MLVLAVLVGCSQNPRASSVSLNGEFVLNEWRCDESEQRFFANHTRRDGTKPSLADKLLQCPFHRNYQIEAMRSDNTQVVQHDLLAEIIFKIRWGIDFQYYKYQGYVRTGPKKHFLIPKFVDRFVPGLSDLLQLGIFLADEDPVSVGQAGPLVIRQMQLDRRATGAAIERHLADYKAGRASYPLWRAMIDLEAYFHAGTANSAMESIDQRQVPIDKSSDLLH